MTYVIIDSYWSPPLSVSSGMINRCLLGPTVKDAPGGHECINEIVTNLIEENKMVTVDEVTKELEKVVDPEIGLPITEMHLVDEVDIKDDGVLFIKYHLTAPFCPPIFAEDIGMNIRQLTSKLDGVKKVTVILHGHALANEINQRVNPGYTPPQSP